MTLKSETLMSIALLYKSITLVSLMKYSTVDNVERERERGREGERGRERERGGGRVREEKGYRK